MPTQEKVTKIFKLGGELEINRMGYGGMQLTGKGVWGDPPDRANAVSVLQAAVKNGVDFFDTADAYGPHTNEVLLRDALSESYPRITIATKGGFERPAAGQWVANGDPAYIRKCIDGSLRRLGLEQITLWQLHRVDEKFPVEETLQPVLDAVKAGKIRYVGLSETDVEQIRRARKVLTISSVQNLYNLGNRKWEEVLEYTQQEGIAFIPWYPLASGPSNMQSKLGTLAEKYKVSVAQLALAWLLKRADNILLIPGTSSVEHLHENIQALDIQLSDEDFASLG